MPYVVVDDNTPGSASLPPGSGLGGTDLLPITLPETAAIERRTVVSNGLLGQTESWSVVATVACRLQKMTAPGEKVEGGALSGRTIWQILFNISTDVRPTDRAVILGSVYQITELDTGLTDAAVLTAFAVRIR